MYVDAYCGGLLRLLKGPCRRCSPSPHVDWPIHIFSLDFDVPVLQIKRQRWGELKEDGLRMLQHASVKCRLR